MVGEGGPQPRSWEADALSFGAALGLSHSRPESHRATSCVSPSITMSQERIKKPAVSGSSPPSAKGKKINKYSLAQGREAIGSSKANVASFCGWGGSTVVFGEEPDSWVSRSVCLFSGHFREVRRIKDYCPFSRTDS